jgi:hypothetical protein
MRVAFIGLAVILATTSSALAQTECKAEPEPAIMSLAEFEKLELAEAKAAIVKMGDDTKQYQTGVKAYRDCLELQIKTIEDKGKKATDEEKASLNKLTETFNASVDAEVKLGNTVNTMMDSLCARGEKAYCP